MAQTSQNQKSSAATATVECMRQYPLRLSESENTWYMTKDQTSPFFLQKYPIVALETWCHLLLRKYYLTAKKLKNLYHTSYLYKQPK